MQKPWRKVQIERKKRPKTKGRGPLTSEIWQRLGASKGDWKRRTNEIRGNSRKCSVFFLIKKNLKFNWFTILQRKCMVKKPKEGITDKRLSQRQSYWIRQERGHCVLEERNFNRMDGMEALNTERTPGPFFVNSFTKI